jgi:hypothetical protein
VISINAEKRLRNSRSMNYDALMQAQTITSASGVIDALGGTSATGRLTGRKPAAVSNWRALNRLPPTTFAVLRAELQRHGYDAPLSLWGMAEPAKGGAAL